MLAGLPDSYFSADLAQGGSAQQAAAMQVMETELASVKEQLQGAFQEQARLEAALNAKTEEAR